MKLILIVLTILFFVGPTQAQQDTTITYASMGNSCYNATLLTTKNPIHVLSTGNGYTAKPANHDTLECYRKYWMVSQATFMRFTCSKAGLMEFTIVPDDPNTEIDWVLYRLTSCENRTKYIQAPLSCNFYDNQNPLGLGKNTGMKIGGAPEDFEPFVEAKKLEANQQYVLMVSNRSMNGKGYSIQWGGNYSLDYQYGFPDAFSPNGDGFNDEFGGVGFGIDVFTYELNVYDRFGKLVYRSYDPDEKWNGNFGNDSKYPLQSGVFVYTLTYINNAGEYFSNKGTVALIK